MKYQRHLLLLALLLPAAAMAQMQGMDMPEQLLSASPRESAATRTIHVEATDTMRLKFDPCASVG
jgi:hypothetical protein